MITNRNALEDFRELTIKLAGGTGWLSRACVADMQGRELVCTPYGGNYGVAGWLIVLNGSPPRLTLIVENNSGAIIAVVSERSRRLGLQHAKIVTRFVATCLRGKTEALAFRDGEQVTT